MAAPLFHLAFPITDIAQAKGFYVDGLGCQVGRESQDSIILNLYSHQLVGHITDQPIAPQKGIYPRHFGLIFTTEAEWEALLERAQQRQLQFYQAAKRRFAGLPLEHRTFFLQDPFQNFLEFKFYCHPEAIFGSRDFSQIGDRSSTS